MKYRPESELLACIEYILRWFLEAERDRQGLELLEEVLNFEGLTSIPDSSATPGSSPGIPDIGLVEATDPADLTPTGCSTDGLTSDATVLMSANGPARAQASPKNNVNIIPVHAATATGKAIVMLDGTRPSSVAPTLSAVECFNAELNAAPKLLDEKPKHVHVDLVA
jgi:hypothetical protein